MVMQGTDAVYAGAAEAARDAVYQDQDLAQENSLEKKTTKTDEQLGRVTTNTIAHLEAELPDFPSEHQRATLRRVPGGIDLRILTVAFVEFAERFSYYGCIAVLTNFIQFPMPNGSTTGSIKGLTGVNTPGALGKGQQAAFGITTFNTFWVYCTPILGAYIADTYWGRFKTVFIAIIVAIIGHIFLIVAAIPSVISNINASYGILILSIVIIGLGAGSFKSNISPLIAEQIPDRHLKVKTMKTGETVIQDPAMTVQRVMMYFYLLINCGALSGQIGMVYAEQDVGFWLSFTIPTIVFCLTPLIMWWGNTRYTKTPPQGSVMAQAFRLLRYACGQAWVGGFGGFYRNVRSTDFWEKAKPSVVVGREGQTPAWMTFDDLWVEEVRKGFKACSVFILMPFYWLCYNQITSNLTSQAATMERNGVPNDLINNLNPISLVIMIPIMDQIVYPFLRKKGINFTAIKRMTLGFYIAALAMVCAAVTQHYIYQQSPCGNRAATCDEVAPINVWIQSPTYILIGISEIFASITGLEYAFNKAPANMRSLVTSMWLFTSAVSAAIGQAFVAISTDPLLVANYGTFAGLSALAGTIFWFVFRGLDAEEHKLNDIRRKGDYIHGERIDGSAGPQYGQAPAPAAASGSAEKV